MKGFSLVVNTKTPGTSNLCDKWCRSKRFRVANHLPVVTQMGICLCPPPTPTVTQHQCPAVDCNEDGKRDTWKFSDTYQGFCHKLRINKAQSPQNYFKGKKIKHVGKKKRDGDDKRMEL